MDAAQAPGAYRFDRFTLDLGRGALLGPDGTEISLRPKSLALLRLLLENPGRVVDRDAIMAAVWPDVVVTDESITQCVRDIRKAVGDEAQALLKTVPKRGYLLAAEVTPTETTAPAPRAERRLSAILAADIVGYSRLIEQDEAATLAAIKALRETAIDPLLAEHKGRIVKLMGDGAIIEFASVVDAVACAVSIQKAVADRQVKSSPDGRIVFRMGVNLGDVVVDGDDLLGDGVNVAARLEQLCEPGGVLVSGTAFDHLQGRLGLPLEFTGEQQVKNIARPVRAYRVRLDGATAGRSATWAPAAKAQRLLLASAAALFAIVFLGGIWHFWPVGTAMAKPAIAVLPFDNLGGDEATGRLADGVTEDIITDLARFRDLDVIARNSTEVYKGKPADVRQVGRDLNVRYVLEGSIQRQDNRVRVTAQLIDARDGAHVWSDRWDRPVEDIFAVQAEVSERVGNRLGGFGVIYEHEQSQALRKQPANLSAYDNVLLAGENIGRFTQESAKTAVALATRAIEIDPTYGRAYVARAWAYEFLANQTGDFASLLPLLKADARKAVTLDPNDAEAHAALGDGLGYSGDLAAGRAEYDRALELNPGSADIMALFATWSGNFGEPERGAALIEQALRVNPSFPPYYRSSMREAYFFSARYQDVVRALLGRDGGPSGVQDLMILAASYAQLGERENARRTAKSLLESVPNFSAELAFNFGYVFIRDRERDLLVEGIRRAELPVCAAEADLAAYPGAVRLPECEADRAKAVQAG